MFNFFSNNNNAELNKLMLKLKSAFKGVKSELDDHLDSINQNTSEIQSTQGFLADLESKIDKLSERLDEIELAVGTRKDFNNNIKLTPREQEVFMALYLGKNLSLSDISKRLGFTTDMVNMYIFNIISKGIPVKKDLIDNEILVFSIDADFKDLQARRNILNIDPRIVKQLAVHDF